MCVAIDAVCDVGGAGLARVIKWRAPPWARASARNVAASGDLFQTTTYPMIDVARGGTVQGIIDGLNRLLDITIPKDKAEGGTYVVPGHGRLSDEADVVEYRDMLTIVRDRIQDLIADGKSLAEVKAAGPTRDYDGRYGAATGPWTTDQFIEAVYRELAKK